MSDAPRQAQPPSELAAFLARSLAEQMTLSQALEARAIAAERRVAELEGQALQRPQAAADKGKR